MWVRAPPRMGAGVCRIRVAQSFPVMISSVAHECCKAKDVTTLAKVASTQRTSKWPIRGVQSISPNTFHEQRHTIRDTSDTEGIYIQPMHVLVLLSVESSSAGAHVNRNQLAPRELPL